MHGSVHDFVVSQTVDNWRELPTGHGQGALIPTILPFGNDFPPVSKFPKVLEIGSLDINGSMRTYDFLGTREPWQEMVGCVKYTGIDLVSGKSVDWTMDAHSLQFAEDSFDLVLCLDVLEHDSDIASTLREGYRVLTPGGLFLVSTVDETMTQHMQEHPVDLPYNFIKEEVLREYLEDLSPNGWQLWHFGCDLFVRIEK